MVWRPSPPRRRALAAPAALAAAAAAAACSAGSGSSGGAGGSGGSGGSGGAGGGTTQGGSDPGPASNAASSSAGLLATSSASGETPPACANPPDKDGDGDGFTGADGDCNDCDVNVNPGAIDVVVTEPDETGTVPEPADEDCDGTADNAVTACDDGIALDDVDGMNAARAIDLCKVATEKSWGVLDAKYVRANGTPNHPSLGAGIQQQFGDVLVPRAGQRMLALSSGHARSESQPDACGHSSCFTNGPGTPPPGFPQAVPNCAGATNINDDVALEVSLRAPTNATGYAFDFNFMSFEYPEYVCTSYNDQFISLVSPPPPGSVDGNVSFDTKKNPVSVNIAFFEVCNGCSLGATEMAGTGYNSWNDAGGTSWLETQVPVTGGEEFTIRFAIWDTGDTALDSLALVDNFRWIASGGTVVIGTTPVPK